MPRTIGELITMIAARDRISYNEAEEAVMNCKIDMENAFLNGDLDEAENALAYWLGLEPDYLELFIY